MKMNNQKLKTLIRDLHRTAKGMRKIGERMKPLDTPNGFDLWRHGDEMIGAAKIAEGWAGNIERRLR